MSDKLDNAELWLPSEFLTEEDIVMDSYGVLGSSRFHFTSEFGSNHGSFTPSTGSSSPVESMFCSSTETQSEEGDSLGSELTQLLNLLRASRFTQSNQYHEKNGFGLSGTQISTLTGLRSGSGRSTMPNNGSPNGSFLVSSHATAPVGGKEDAWDLIYKAAGQASMLKNNGGCGATFPPNPRLLGPQRILTQKPSIPIPSPLYRSQLKSENLLEQEMWNKKENKGLVYEQIYRRRAVVSDGLAVGFNSFACVRPEVQLKNQQGAKGGLGDGYGFGPGYGYGSGARVVGVGGGKSERVGTGVFLPRRYGTDDSSGNGCSAAVRPRKKLGSTTTVGLQAKGNPILKNLNNPTSVSTCPSQLAVSRGNASANETSVARRAALLTLQRAFPEGAATAAINLDVCLPQEWTY